MSTQILCILPSERSEIAPQVIQAGGIPVIDITLSDRVPIPIGTWVRTRVRRAVPGKGPVILAGENHKSPIRNRETWLETSRYKKTPKGFAGIILRGSNVGGITVNSDIWEKLAKADPNQRIIIDAGSLPEDMPKLKEKNIEGVILHDVLMAMPELLMPNPWAKLINAQDPSFCQRTKHASVFSPLLSDGVQKVAEEKNWWKICHQWLSKASPNTSPAPFGSAILHAPNLKNKYKTLSRLIRAYNLDLLSPNTDAEETDRKPPSIPSPQTRKITQPKNNRERSQEKIPTTTQKKNISSSNKKDEPIAIIGLGCRFPEANTPDQFWSNIVNKKSSLQ